MFKKINAFLAALTITATAAGMLPANAEENYSATTSTTQDTKPSKVDLSKDYEINLLFPEIENQGSTSSCVSFTTAYYQFTYEARKAYFDKYGVIPNFRISPAFVFNHLNYGENEGSFLSRAYDFLENMGALTWEDAPFVEEGYDYSYQEGRPEMLCKALKMRISNVEKAMKSSTEDDRMEDLKQKLREGKVIATSSYFKLFDNDMAVTIDPKTKTVNKADAEFVYMQCNKKNDTGGWHAITIVGYDDDIEYTYKGKIYKGAFKVANSWGDDWCNKGFIWFSYDAFRRYSQYGINNEHSGYSRAPSFELNFGSNSDSSVVDVEIKDIKLIAEADIESNKLSGISLKTTDIDDTTNYNKTSVVANNYKDPYQGSVVADIDPMCKGDYFTGKTYNVKVETNYGLNTKVNAVSLRDDLGKVVASASVAEGEKGADIYLDLKRGDVNYDGEVNADDRDMVIEYVESKRYYRTATTKFSTLQRDLMDVNNDGEINDEDVNDDVFFWTEDGKYKSTDGAVYRGWQYINDAYYFLDYSGTKVTKQFIYDADYNGEFYVDETGRCKMDSLFSVNGKLYYADPNGLIVKNCEVAIPDMGKTRVFYFNENGEAYFGWSSDRTKYYSTAGMLTGEHIIDGVKYVFDENGVLINE